MKRIFALLVVIAACFAVYSCNSASASKSSTSSLPDKELAALGFTNLHSAAKQIKLRIRKAYDLDFISDSLMGAMTETNELMWGSASFYKGDIPPMQATKIIENFNKVSPNEKRYYMYPGLGFQQIGSLSNGDQGVFVLAPPDMFTDAAQLHSKKDPMVVVKIDGGWIVLAVWN